MSEATQARYSLDFDPEFDDMLTQIKMLKSHSSLIEDDFETVDSGFSQSPGNQSSPDSCLPVNNNHQSEKKHINSKRTQGKRSSVNSIQIDTVSIELSDDENTTVDSEGSGTELEADIDLNATYSARTMGNRKLSLWLDVLKDLEEEDELEHNMNGLCIERGSTISYSPLPCTPYKNAEFEVTPSPRTPCNSVEPIPDRSYRLRCISAYNETPCTVKKAKKGL